jgi:hypothetical protein
MRAWFIRHTIGPQCTHSRKDESSIEPPHDLKCSSMVIINAVCDEEVLCEFSVEASGAAFS